MSKSDDRRLDAYLAGDLSPQEQRALAQASLEDPELFDQLASAAAVNAATTNEPAVVGRRSPPVRLRWMLSGAAAAAATIAAIVSIDRPTSTPAPAPGTTTPGSSATRTEPASQPASLQPIILTARLGDLPRTQSPEFRSPADASRAPKGTGVVVSADNGEVEIDLGSLDGLAKGSDVQVVRAGVSAPARLTITTVFRERSRGRATSSDTVRVGDRVEVPPALQLSALWERALSRVAAGDTDAARTAAQQAVTLSANARGAASADTMNELAGVLINSGDVTDAESLLRRAQADASGVTAVRVANNLGALAALRGDVMTAESMYRSALTMAGTGPEYEPARQSIEKNLQDLRAR